MIKYQSNKDVIQQRDSLEHSLCGCFNDCSVCMFAWCCPPCAAAKAWSMARNEECSISHLCIYPSGVWTRANIRRAYGIEGMGVCSSYALDCCCPCCFTAQNIRELKLINGEYSDKECSSA